MEQCGTTLFSVRQQIATQHGSKTSADHFTCPRAIEATLRVQHTANPMKKILCIAALLISSATFASNTSPESPVSSIILMPWDIAKNSDLPKELKQKGFNHITFYLNWNEIEREKSQYDYSHYHNYLDNIVNSGMKLILVLDMGGRPYINESGKVIKDEYTMPTWIYAKYQDSLMKNFSGNHQKQADFSDGPIRKHSAEFISHTVSHFSKRYQGKILGFAIGLQEEHEIKYGQTGYQWRDYNDATENDFKKKYGEKQPVINYNNEIKNGMANAEPLLHAHKEYRENRLKETTCSYAKAIRDQGGVAMGYFAETFTSHDGIYATGVVEKLASCIDIAVIDYNFYDGYQLVPDSHVLPTLANYMGSLGYKKVLVGAYAEQWERKNKTLDLVPVINQTISKSLLQSNVIGFELGGLQQQQAAKNESAAIEMKNLDAIFSQASPLKQPEKEKKFRIGILGSATNFYVWHGERSGGRNIHRDALFESFKILNSQPDMDVQLIGEINLLQDDPVISKFDAILVPHQIALPASIKSKLTTYWKNGGALVQDMRLGEFDENGKPTFDWMHEVFGIEKINWKKRGGIFMMGDQIYRLKPSRRLYTSYASITPRAGYQLLATDIMQRDSGIMVRGERTLAFGLMPQLVEDSTQGAWRKLFVQEIRNVAQKNKRLSK